MAIRRTVARTRKPVAPSEPPLSTERIVAAAISLMDANGPGGLTMRKLSEHLGCGVMSLYWHVKHKEEVFDLALDAVLAYREPLQSTDWQADVHHLLADWRRVMLRHPWSASLLPRQVLGSNTLIRLDVLSRALARAGVPPADLNAAIWSLWNYVMGATVTFASFNLSDADRTAAQSRLEDLSGHHPAITHTRLLLDDDWEGVFAKGLGFLLKGLAAGDRGDAADPSKAG
jgi:AcrR family transcriptional regulator